MNEDRQKQTKANGFKSVELEINRTHSVNYEEPLVDEQTVLGLFKKIDEDNYVVTFNSEVNGEPLSNTIKLNKGSMSWVVFGENVHHYQKFKQKEWASNQFCFDTFGVVTCRNKTRRLDYHFNQEGGFIDIFYELYSGETHLGFYSLEIMIGE